MGDAVHPAHGLKHGGLVIQALFKHDARPKRRIEQRAHRQRFAAFFVDFRGARQALQSSPGRACVYVVRSQVSETPQKCQHPLPVFAGDILVERALADRLCQ